jgi:hypothetical protein
MTDQAWAEGLTSPAQAPGVLPGADSAEPLLRTEHLTKHFKIGNTLSRRTLHAVDDVT